MERFTADIGGGRREWLFRPGRAGAPLVLFLTGTGGTAQWADRETGWSALAERAGFALAIPEALPPNPDAATSFLKNPPRWNDGSPPLFDAPQFDDVEFLEAVLDRCAAPQAFVCGFSNGAGMAFRFASERSARVAAVAPVAGHCWLSAPNPARPVPTLFVIGTEDRLVPLRGGDVPSPWLNRLVRRPPVNETLEKWALANGCTQLPELVRDGPVRAERYPGPVRFEALTVEGLGHHWPGGRAQLNPRLAGPPSAALSATDVVWEFFAAHSEPSLTLPAR